MTLFNQSIQREGNLSLTQLPCLAIISNVPSIYAGLPHLLIISHVGLIFCSVAGKSKESPLCFLPISASVTWFLLSLRPLFAAVGVCPFDSTIVKATNANVNINNANANC